MKSVLSDKCCKKEEKPFPKLMIAFDHNPRKGLVVLFSEEGAGVVVHTEDNIYEIGDHSTCWPPSYYKDYEGDVCLTND